jgi:integrase
MKPWVLHDLRRTARTLMAKVGVPEDISERVLNHKKKGIVAVYNRHEYFVEKADALTRLAAEIERIVKPAPAAAKLRLVRG